VIEWRVMAHPARSVMAEALASYLRGVVVYDPEPDAEPSAWRTARIAWGRPASRSHVGVIQDDCVPCERFPPKAKAFVEQHADSLVSFYLGSGHASVPGYEQDRRSGRPFHQLVHGHFVPTLCLVMPAYLAKWAATMEPDCPYDDEVIGRWRSSEKLSAVVPIPTMVDHSNAVKTLMWQGHPKYPVIRYSA